jgi:integrase
MGTVRKIINKSGKPSWQIDYIDPAGKRVRQTFKKKKDADAEIGKRITDFTFHDLRHTFASHFVMRGGSLKD